MEYMEAQMQRQFDAWDAQMAAAQADLTAYIRLMRHPDALDAFIAIEEAWDLFGYAPEIVCTVLGAVAGGKGFDAALEEALNPSGVIPTPAEAGGDKAEGVE